MSDINAAIEKIAERLKKVAAALAKALEELVRKINNAFKELGEAINEACYKLHLKATTKPPYIKQIKKARKREAFKK